MKALIFTCVVSLATVCSFGAGKNLLPDDFTSDNLGGFVNWGNIGGAGLELLPESGPAGGKVVRMTDVKGESYLTHRWRAFSTNGEYRLSANVRTHGGVGRNGTVQLHNRGWTREVKAVIPLDTRGQWRHIQWKGRLPSSPDGTYGVSVVFYQEQPEGFSADVSDLRLEALDGRDEAAASPIPRGHSYAMRLTPVDPPLDELDSRSAKMRFYYPGDFKPGLLVEGILAGKTARGEINDKGFAALDFGPIPEGRHTLKAHLVGSVPEVSNAYACATKAVIQNPTPGRRLNNFVTELYTKELRNGEYEFVLERESIVYIGFDKAYQGVMADIDGMIKGAIWYRKNEPSETMRSLPAGRHFITVTGVNDKCAGGTITVRLVKCIHSDVCVLSVIPALDLCKYGYARGFCEEFGLFSGINSVSYTDSWRNSEWDAVPMRKFIDRGIDVVYSTSYHPEDPDRFDADRNRNRVLAFSPVRNGAPVLIDENSIAADTASKYNITEVMWELRERDVGLNACFNDGFTQLFSRPRLDIPEISAYVNSRRGGGQMLSEMYLRSVPDEAGYLKTMDFLRRQIRGIRTLVPSAPSHYLYYLSGWQMPSIWTTWNHVNMDMNAFLSRVLKDLATDPEFADIGGVGISTPACDEDLPRFVYALFRHYCIEGRRDDFAAARGMKLFMKHVQNGDFDEGLKGWHVVASRPDAIQHREDRRIVHVQSRNQQWTAYGSNVAIFAPKKGESHRLEQEIQDLRPGELYSVSFAAVNYAEVTNSAHRSANPPRMRADFKGVDLIPELTHVQTFRGKYAADRKPALTMFRYVFRAQMSHAKIELSDGFDPKSPSSDDPVAVNYVICRPYYVKDADELHRLRAFYSKKEN